VPLPWANFRKTKGAVKLHTLLDLRGSIPTFIHISDGKLHEVNTLDIVPLEAGAFYTMDRGYLDFERLYTISQACAFFVIRAKSNLKCRRVYSQPVDKATGLVCDKSVLLAGFYQFKDYPGKLRRVKYHDAESDKNCRVVPVPLAGGAVLQTDQAKPANQDLLRLGVCRP